jgi:hypothetical protein
MGEGTYGRTSKDNWIARLKFFLYCKSVKTGWRLCATVGVPAKGGVVKYFLLWHCEKKPGL